MAKKKTKSSSRQMSLFGSNDPTETASSKTSSGPLTSPQKKSTQEKPVKTKSTQKPAEEKLPEEKPAAELNFPNVVIRASAGTGKTFQLSNRFIQLVSCGVDPRTILATTFTKKAAGEILERIIKRVTEASLNQQGAEKLSSEIELELTIDQYQSILKKLTSNLHSLQISTLDSIFSQIARNFCFELDLPQNWSIIDEQEETRIVNRAISQTLSQENALNLIRLMSKDDAERNISAEIRGIVSDLGPIYHRSSSDAWQMNLAEEKYSAFDLTSVYAVLEAFEPGKHKAIREATEKALQPLEKSDIQKFFKSTLIKNCMDGNYKYKRSELPEGLVIELPKLIRQVKSVFRKLLNQRNVTTFQFLDEFDKQYRPLKSSQGELTFSNVQQRLSGWIDSLTDPANRLTGRLDFNIQHLLLDEFQDTVPSQWMILRPIAEKIFSDNQKSKNQTGTFFCVGDQKQAIYRWRGGDARIFASVEESFQNITLNTMETSYRSSKTVLDCVNQVFNRISGHDKSDQWNGITDIWHEIFKPHDVPSNRKSPPGYCELIGVGKDSEKTLAEASVDVVEQQLQLHPEKSIGILAPNRGHVAKIIAALSARSIPASEESGVGLCDSACVNLLLSILQLLDYPNDSASFYHLFESDKDFQILNCFDQSHRDEVNSGSLPVAELIKDRRFLSWVDKNRQNLIQQGYGKTVKNWCDHLLPYARERDQKKMQHAVHAAFSYDLPLPLRPSEFARHLRLLQKEDPTADQVRVMTIHQSKGLEFDTVILTELDGDLIRPRPGEVVDFQPDLQKQPTLVSRFVGKDLQKALPKAHQKMFANYYRELYHEQLCKLYVAMTRARQGLFMVINGALAKSHKQSLAGILKATLWDAEKYPAEKQDHQQVFPLFQLGDTSWMNPKQEKSDQKPKAESSQSQPKTGGVGGKKRLLKENQAGFQRGMQRKSPSGLEGDSTFPLLSLLSTKERSTAQLKGEIIHSWFELVHWLDGGVPSEQDLVQRAKLIDPAEEKWRPWIHEFFESAKQSEVVRVLSKSFYTSPSANDFHQKDNLKTLPKTNRLIVHNERPFAITTEEGMLNGFIDRLVYCFNGTKLIHAEILDFKTDRIDEDKQGEVLKRKVKHYRPQLQAYCKAVAKLTGLPSQAISARLLFLDANYSVLVS